MNTKAKMQFVEKHLGGPGRAATAAGVKYVTWYRWREDKRAITARTERTLDLLIENINGNSSNPLPVTGTGLSTATAEQDC